MNKTSVSFFSWGGLALFLSAVILGGGWILIRQWVAQPSHQAQVFLHSQPVGTIPLTDGVERWYHLDPDSGNFQEISGESLPAKGIAFHLFADGSVCFEESDCPDRLCVKKGKLSIAGEIAVCLPNGVVLQLEGEGDQPDIVV